MKKVTKCIRTARAGRFKVSLLKLTKTVEQPEELRDFIPEVTREQYRIAIQYSRKIDGDWKNETIYCSTEDFKNLQNGIEDFHNGDDESPSLTDIASMEVNF